MLPNPLSNSAVYKAVLVTVAGVFATTKLVLLMLSLVSSSGDSSVEIDSFDGTRLASLAGNDVVFGSAVDLCSLAALPIGLEIAGPVT